MIIAFYILGVLAMLIALILAIGAILPVKHMAQRSVELNAPTDKVWAKITDYTDMPSWRKDLHKIEMKIGTDGQPIWQEFENKTESLDFETTEQIDGQKLVRKIVGDRSDFGGTWTFELVANADDRTTLTITENGEVYNVLFRFVSKYIIGHHGSIDKYIHQLTTAL